MSLSRSRNEGRGQRASISPEVPASRVGDHHVQAVRFEEDLGLEEA